MPEPYQTTRNSPIVFGPFARSLMPCGEEVGLVHEIAELRKEIAALRAELAPVPSLIVTGKKALEEFKRLTHDNG